MALRSASPPNAREPLESLPTFALTCRYDDVDDPAELTVFPATADDERPTTWLTVDVEHAVPLETVR